MRSCTFRRWAPGSLAALLLLATIGSGAYAQTPNLGAITGAVRFTPCAGPPCVPPNVTDSHLGSPPGLFPDEAAPGTLVAAVAAAGPQAGTVLVTTEDSSGAYALPVPAFAAAAPSVWQVTAVNPGAGLPTQGCSSGQVCGHRPSAPVAVAGVLPGETAVAAPTMPLKTAPPSDPAGFAPLSVNNDIGVFGYIVDLTTGQPVNGVVVDATCPASSCANNVQAMTLNNQNPNGPDAGSPGYFFMGGLSRNTAYTFQVVSVPAGFRLVDGCKVTAMTAPRPLFGRGTWIGVNLCVEWLPTHG
jgi:hypothetical protein